MTVNCPECDDLARVSVTTLRKTEAALAVAQARASGLALVVAEMRAVLQAWADADPITGEMLVEHFRVALAQRDAILASDPEARGQELLRTHDDA